MNGQMSLTAFCEEKANFDRKNSWPVQSASVMSFMATQLEKYETLFLSNTERKYNTKRDNSRMRFDLTKLQEHVVGILLRMVSIRKIVRHRRKGNPDRN